jgi:hypothetical protein
MEKLFIVGCPRSGTTMVQQALNRHTQIVIPPETKFFFSFYGQPWRQQARHVERLQRDLGIDLPTPRNQVRSVPEGRAYYELMADRHLERVGKKNVAYFGEKTPEHTGHLPRIRELFPNAKILVLCRDGRDVATSLSHVPWMSSDLYVNFLVWLYYSWVVRAERSSGNPHVHFARYEDIVADPERQMGKILDFLGLPYEPAVARGCGNREGIPEREYLWKAKALEKITTERVGAFRTELSGEQIEVLERLGRDALTALGYPLLTDGNAPLPLSLLLRLSCSFSGFVYRLPWHSILSELSSRFSAKRLLAPASA